MNFLSIMLSIWLLSAIPSYLLMRREHKRSQYLNWDNANRCGALAFSLCCGPYLLIVCLIWWCCEKVAQSAWGKREVRW